MLGEYQELEREVSELDRERQALKEQMERMLKKIGYNVTAEFREKLEQC